MKTILIATDFSNASHKASIYALHLARGVNANIILFNAYQVPPAIAAINMSISRYDVMKQTEKKLADEADKLNYINVPPIKIICDEGVAEDAIIKMANEKKADFIITGMKSSAKNIRRLFGSTVTGLARKSNIPVMIIPEATKFMSPKTILYASDISFDNAIQPIDQIKAITQMFNSKLYIVRVVKDELSEMFELYNAPSKLRKELKILNTSFEYPINTNISHALNDFVHDHQIDMLAMMPHKHGWINRLFRKSETKAMIFHTHIPLIIIPEKSLGS